MANAHVYMLGALPPDVESALNGRLADLGALQQQAVDDMILVGESGANITAFQSQLNTITQQIQVLQAELATLDVAGAATFAAQADQIKKQLLAILDQLAKLKQSNAGYLQNVGLQWGLGISLVVAALGYAVYTHRKRR